MMLVLEIINKLKDYYINPQDYLIVYFTILGILVTLISITSSLTREVRQDLIVKYFLRGKLVAYYSLYLLITFAITSLLYFFDYVYLNILVFLLFIVTFFYSFIFVALYILGLDRKRFYSKLFEEFKKEVKSKKGIRKDSTKLNYSKTQFESLDSLIKNLSYVEKNNQDFIEEVKLIKGIMKYCISNDKLSILIDFFNKDVARIKDSSFFENIISVLYELKFESHTNLKLMRIYQDFLYNLTERTFYQTKKFDARLNTSGLYIKEFLDIRYIDEFKQSNDLSWINLFSTLISNTITRLYELNKLIIGLDLENKTKKRYLLTQLGELNKVLEHYMHLHKTDFLKNYYDKDVDDSKKELADHKLSIVKKQQEYVKEKQSELFYLLLYNIDREELTKDFFEMALKIYNLKDFDKKYYRYERFDKLDWLNYDWFSGGVQSIAPFNFNRYRLLISFYKFLDTGEIDIKKFENENFTNISYSFEKELDNVSEKFISKYYDYDKKKFSQFKKKILKEIKEKKESLKRNKQDYIIKKPLKKEHVDKFIFDCKEAWQKNQNELSEFVEINEIKGGNKVKSFFGQYSLFDKEWFLDSFDKNVSLSRDSGKDFGRSQGNSKLRQVLDIINRSFDNKKDKEIIIKDIYSDLTKLIQPNKDYFLFYGSDFKIYDLPNLNWSRQGIETASLEINNSIIHFCYSHNPNNLLFEKNAFVLKQYKQGYETINEPLVIQIEPIDDMKEIKTILDKNKKFKSKDEIKQMVKIRIAEKFEIERNKNIKIIRLKI